MGADHVRDDGDNRFLDAENPLGNSELLWGHDPLGLLRGELIFGNARGQENTLGNGIARSRFKFGAAYSISVTIPLSYGEHGEFTGPMPRGNGLTLLVAIIAARRSIEARTHHLAIAPARPRRISTP
jgi:hypothetical protein